MEKQEQRFNRLNAEGGCGYQGHWRYIQVEKEGQKKQVLIKSGNKTIQDMLAQIEKEQKIYGKGQKKQEEKSKKYEAIIQGAEGKMKLNQKMSMGEIADLGIQKIQIKKYSQKTKYPDLPQLPCNYFNVWKKQAQIKQKKQTQIKQIQQTFNLKIQFQGKNIWQKFNKTQKITELKQKINSLFKLDNKQMKLTFQNKSLDFDDKTLEYYALNDKCQINVARISCLMEKDQTIKVQCSQIKLETLQFDLVQSMLVMQLKWLVSQKVKFQPNKIRLFHGNIDMENSKSLKDYGIVKGSTLHLRLNESLVQPNQIQTEVSKMVQIRTLQQKVVKFSYQTIKNKTVKDIVALINTQNRPYFCLLYGNLLLKPEDIINQVQKQSIFKSSVTIIGMNIVSSAQKHLFYSQMFGAFDSLYQSNVGSRQARKNAIANYRNKQFNQKINEFIFQFPPKEKKKAKTIEIEKKVKQILSTFLKMDNYQSQSKYSQEFKIDVMKYDCVKRERYARFHQRHKIGECFYWKEFTSTMIQQDVKQLQNGGTYETLYLIRSITGKQIGKVNKIDVKEVVFLPFTYFVIDHIVIDKQQETEFQIIYLSEMPTPRTFDKSIELWVDDYPAGNSSVVKKIMEENQQVDVLQILNTKTLQIWMSQFNWIFNWAKISLKIITDMRRVQVDYSCKNSQEEKKKNTYIKLKDEEFAGVTLIQSLYKISGYTVQTFVYCKDVKGAKQQLAKKITNEKIYYEVSDNPNALRDYAVKIE